MLRIMMSMVVVERCSGEDRWDACKGKSTATKARYRRILGPNRATVHEWIYEVPDR